VKAHDDHIGGLLTGGAQIMKFMGTVEGSLTAFEKVGVGAGGDDHFTFVYIYHLPGLMRFAAPQKVLGKGIVGYIHQVCDGELCVQFMGFVLNFQKGTFFLWLIL